MPKFKYLILGKASISKAKKIHYFSSKAVKFIHFAISKSKSRTLKPPNSNYVFDTVSYSNSHHGPTAFTASLWRLRVAKKASVTIKSLILFHKFIKSLGDKVEGLDGGRNNLKFNDFTDKYSNLTLELSQWVRWYGPYLDHLSWISKLLGSYPILKDSSKEKAKEQDCVSSYQTGYIMRQTDSLVTFFEHLCTRPEIPPLYQNKTVDEIRELVIQDYFTVVRLVMVRLQVLSERLIKPGFEHVDDFNRSDLSLVLVRLEECKTSLSGFFWCCRRLAEDFWCMVEKLKAEMIKANAESVDLSGSVQLKAKSLGDNTEMAEMHGSVQNEWVTFNDSEMEIEEEVKWNSHWVTFDDSRMTTNEVGKWNLKWETFDDSKGLMN